MKTNSKVFVLLCGCLLAASTMLTSCEDFLEEKNYGNPTKLEMTQDEGTIVMMVGQAYADVKWLHDHWGYWGVNLLTTDEGVCPVRMPGSHWSDAGYWRNLNTHNWNAFGDAFKNIWNTTISGAILCNKLINVLDSCQDVMAPANYKLYKAELSCLRSYYYFMLYDCFGRIPYIESFVQTEAEPLMASHLVWAHLVYNLEQSAKDLPAIGIDKSAKEYYGRCSKAFAYALLARLYINAPSYKTYDNGAKEFIEALTSDAEAMALLDSVGVSISSETDFYNNACRCCEQIISGKAGSYQIEPNFFTNFKIDNQESRENIFVIVEDGRANFDYRDYAGSMANKLRVTMLTLHYNMQSIWNLKEKPWNGFCARSEFIERYDKEDVRGPGNEGKGTLNQQQWGWFVGPVYNKQGTAIQYDDNQDTVIIKAHTAAMDNVKWLDEATWNDGARMFKYEVDKSGTYKYCENDFVLVRLADIYWLNEEAIKRGGTGTTHLNDAAFKTIMARAFANNSKTEDERVAMFKAAYGDPASWTEKEICQERGREFAWENVRRRDLIRCGEFEKIQYVRNGDGNELVTRRWFPIPFQILEKAERDEKGNPIWTQNEGY